MMIADSVDVRKEVCSRPVLDVRIKMRKIKPGEILEVLADDSSHKDILRIFGKILKHEVVESRPMNNHVRILLRKTEWGR